MKRAKREKRVNSKEKGTFVKKKKEKQNKFQKVFKKEKNKENLQKTRNNLQFVFETKKTLKNSKR